MSCSRLQITTGSWCLRSQDRESMTNTAGLVTCVGVGRVNMSSERNWCTVNDDRFIQPKGSANPPWKSILNRDTSKWMTKKICKRQEITGSVILRSQQCRQCYLWAHFVSKPARISSSLTSSPSTWTTSSLEQNNTFDLNTTQLKRLTELKHLN